VGGHFYVSSNEESQTNTRAVLNIAQIIMNVTTSAAEAEISTVYITTRLAILARFLLEEVGHHQPTTPMQYDTTALGFVKRNMQPKAMKSTNMIY
jgi:hypothetical protein